ncbi:MAG: restriction endonuclease subunit S [Microcystis aeruginosa Ma_MB_F_20061100_S19]|nr:restriction endonuclease subunit S [Microcystis aeruginosa L311-01]OCY14131.1 MAG: type I restriction endonuclease subunit S [Microcystis aeruginosa CACIAM 03]TRU11320.1 MAG: restriction endonuclease subunit S [Microcystis aeruginosa Ma_MB_F_20061100_S19D]TRU15350.1 MAG: restriction endonuclease subunit S [Microcystis aeruginosa Ma_MB_F_20061100_S19]
MRYKPPSSWQKLAFKDAAEVITGSTPSTKEPENYGEYLPFVTPGELDLGEPIIHAETSLSLVGKAKARTVPKDSVLVCCIGSLGKVGITGREVAFNQQINALVFNEKLVCPRYGYHYCRTLKPLLSHMAPSTTVAIVNKSRFQSLEIPLPPLEEQRRIAAILDKADGVRRKRKEAIRLTEELLKSTFLEMFGDPVTNPKGWEICELQNVCNRVTDGTHQPPNWADEGIPFLFVSNIVNGEIDFKVSKHITEESWFELTSRCPIEINDILYTTVGSYGNAALVRTKNRFCFQRHIAHIKPDSRSIEPEFLLGMMQSDWIRQQADKQARGVAQKTLNLRELKKFTIFTPPIEEQKKYVKLRQGVETQLSYYRSALEQSENLFNSLLQRAFRGEL